MECRKAIDISNGEIYVPSHQPSKQVRISEEDCEMCKGLFVVVGFRNNPFEVQSALEWSQCLNDRGFNLVVTGLSSTQGLLPIPRQIAILHLLAENIQCSCNLGGTVLLDTNNDGQSRPR